MEHYRSKIHSGVAEGFGWGGVSSVVAWGGGVRENTKGDKKLFFFKCERFTSLHHIVVLDSIPLKFILKHNWDDEPYGER